MKRKLIIGITVFSMLMMGCQSSGVEKNNESSSIENAQEKITENETIVPEKEEAVAVDYKAEKEALIALINKGRFVEFKEVLPNYVNDFTMEDMDELFIENYNYLESNLMDEINLYYSEDIIGIHEEIANALGEQNRSIICGDNKQDLLQFMTTDAYKEMVKKTLEKGYALYNGEGSYYPQLDYVELSSLYNGKVSEMYSDYLTIMAEELKQPLTVEEYLSVDLETLKSRMYSYETFLQKYGKTLKNEQPKMFDFIRIQFSVAIWNTVNPNQFNGLVGDDYYPTQEAVDFYKTIISDDQHPITSEAASRILKVIEEKREEVFGSFEKMDGLYPLSQNIADDLNMKLEMGYN